MFGEIDCREGLPLAVQQCKYADMSAAMDAVASIYLDVLLRLVEERGLELFVHPPAPVLNETRHIVAPFAALLKSRVLEAAPRLKGRLHWLDFFDSLLTPAGDRLRPEYEFDGTHLAPAYVSKLAEALSGV